MKSYAEKFRSYLSEKKLKLTRERYIVLQAALSSKDHFSPEDLFLRMRADGAKISRSSIYRTLTLLYECGLIEEAVKIDKHTHYERMRSSEHHDHMICVKCGKVIEFYSEALEKLQDEICKQKNFRSLRHCLEIHGACDKCST